MPAPPAWYPGRHQPQYNQPGNPIAGGQPSMAPGLAYPGGVIPAPAHARGVEAWSDRKGQSFRSDGTNQVWVFETPVFDLRPGVSDAYGNIAAATPINHEGAYGLNIYLCLLVSTDGALPPARVTDIRAEYWEDGNNLNGSDATLRRLTQDIDVTEQLIAGGTTIVAPVGASPIILTPCVYGLRFWKVSLRLTIPGVAAITEPFWIQGMLH